MKTKINIIALVIYGFLNLANPAPAWANVAVVSKSAELRTLVVGDPFDTRVTLLKKYLIAKNSPISEHAKVFVKHADENNLDWRLVPSITGVESSFGKRIPSNSFNAYGWVNGVYKFNSWDHSIEVVTEALNERYYERGATNISRIAKRYAPPSSTWAGKVKYFMKKIDPVPVQFDL